MVKDVQCQGPLNCGCGILDQSRFPITWIVWQNEERETKYNGSDSDWLFQSNTVKDTGWYSCQCANLYGPSDWSNSVYVTVEGILIFQFPIFSPKLLDIIAIMMRSYI